MNSVQGAPADAALAQAQQLAQSGRTGEAQTLCEQILAREPEHWGALNFLAMLALAQGGAARGKELLSRALAVAPQRPMLYRNLALAHAALGDYDAALAALDQALALKSDFAPALLHKAALVERNGDGDKALHCYHAALEAAHAQGLWLVPEQVPPNLRPLLGRAAAVVGSARKAFIDERLAPLRKRVGDAALARVDKCIDIQIGRQQLENPHPMQRPTFLAFPDLPARNFFAREDFPELAVIEAATADIQAELAAVLNGTEGFRPFIDMPAGPGAEYWQKLNRSSDWNAFFFYREGVRFEDNCRRCPKTAAALDALNLCRIPEHSPEVLFSILTPGTHIPPHTGVTNTRLVCHLPLIVPGNGALKVGGEAREWNIGRCMVFDDTFEHEAWNFSDQTRVVLIFDLWNCYLTEVEREAVALMVESLGRFDRQLRLQ